MRTVLFIVLISALASARVILKYRKSDGNKVIQRYVVYPGLDATVDEVEEWQYGYATPFNVFFGPKPYVVGWMGGEGPFVQNPDEEYEETEEGEEIEEEKKKKPKEKSKTKH